MAPRTVRRRRTSRRGRGIFGDAGGWLGRTAGNALGGVLGFGRRRTVRRKRVRRKPARGRGIFGDAGGWLGRTAGNALGGWIGGLGRRRRVVRRKRPVRGRGFMDWAKKTVGQAQGLYNRGKAIYDKHSKASTVSNALRDFGLNNQAVWVKSNLGLGRRRRAPVRRGRGMAIGGAPATTRQVVALRF